MSAPERLDLRGLKCPLPVMRTRRRLAGLDIGALLRVETSDPLAVVDIPAFCHAEGHVLRDSAATPFGHQFVIERGATA